MKYDRVSAVGLARVQVAGDMKHKNSHIIIPQQFVSL